jgi:polysaccharide biosynthesis/export protein
VASNLSSNGMGIVSMESLDDSRQLDRGDVISFRVVEDREEPKQLVITELGELEVPYAGRYVALNKTCKQLAQELKAYLEKELYFKATVIIALDFQNKNRDKDKQSPGKVTVVGEVRAPGVQVIPGDDVLTVSRAILAAGGFGLYANKKKVTITRTNSANTNLTRKITVDLTEIWDKGKFDKDEKLEPGDWINVPSTIFRFK